MPTAAKKIFIVDAMAHIYRAFYAPMVRMNSASGMPTKVPFLFSNILRRLTKDYQPDYIAIVFDTSAPTFRDKLFEKYKEHRAPMPDELRQQIPYVRKLCEAMHLPILEMDGYEADDVIGAMALQASKLKLDVLIITNDKDMMQLVCGNVRVLRTGTGGAKSDVIVDEGKVQELLGVKAEQVVDYMALLGDTIDNIPGAKGIGNGGGDGYRTGCGGAGNYKGLFAVCDGVGVQRIFGENSGKAAAGNLAESRGGGTGVRGIWDADCGN